MTMVPAAAPVTGSVMQTSWRQRRAALTHDWLRNRLLPRLGAGIAIGYGDAKASTTTVAALLSTVHEWPEHRYEVVRLVEEFCDAMSPLRAIGDVQLLIPADVVSYLRRATLEAWKVRHRVVELLDEVRAAHADVENSYAAFLELCRDSSGRTAVSDVPALQAMAKRFERLAQSLCNLPDNAVF